MVARAIERGADIVAHAAIHREEGAATGNSFAWSGGVERDAGAGDDAAAWLDEQARWGEAITVQSNAQGRYDGIRVATDGGILLTGMIGDAPAPTWAELAECDAFAVSGSRGDLHEEGGDRGSGGGVEELG